MTKFKQRVSQSGGTRTVWIKTGGNWVMLACDNALRDQYGPYAI